MEKYKINLPKYNYILKNVIFNEPKKEREIFELSTKGYNNTEIGFKIGMSSKTVYRRKKEINKKIMHLL